LRGAAGVSGIRHAAAGEILMTANGWLQIFFLLLVVLLITKPLGGFMTRVFGRERTWLDPVMRPVERVLYKLRAWTKATRWTGRNTRWRCFCSAAFR
jgi:K+-transporting ATPase ATPase A chain